LLQRWLSFIQATHSSRKFLVEKKRTTLEVCGESARRAWERVMEFSVLKED